MMLSANLNLRAHKSQAYFDSLCKHFARKVAVVRDGNRASVSFPAGDCSMSVNEGELMFVVTAQDRSALDDVRMIISMHVVRFSEIDEADMNWCFGETDKAGVHA